MARFVVKNGHCKETCYDEIGLCVQNIDIVLCLLCMQSRQPM